MSCLSSFCLPSCLQMPKMPMERELANREGRSDGEEEAEEECPRWGICGIGIQAVREGEGRGGRER